MNLQQTLTITVDIARAAGDILRNAYKQHKQIEHKSSAIDLVTEFDRAAEALITARLTAAFPDHRLVAEEGGESNITGSPYTWYIDPLDGTNNFAHGYPLFTVSLALYEGDQPLVAVIYEPLRDECFSAVAGQGAQLTTVEETKILRVSQASRLLDSLLATGFPYDRHTSDQDNVAQLTAFLKQAQGIRRSGSAALDLAYVAAGRLDGYWEFKLNSWDVAAGILLVREAGGRVTAIDGGPLHLAYPVSLIASNGRNHTEMVRTIED